MTSRPRIVVLSGCYLPGFRGGGPMRSLVNLVAALSGDFDFHIITLDRDQPGERPYAGVVVGQWQEVSGAKVLYLSRSDITLSRLVCEISGVTPQLVYLNGVFDPVFSGRVLLARRLGKLPSVPVLLAPLGDLSAGALEIKATKKSVYLRVARLAGLFDGLTWQASTELERADILKSMTHVRPDAVRIAADLTDDGEVEAGERPPRTAASPLRVCYLSRITPKKNLDFALRVLAAVSVPVDFTIFGPVDDEAFWAACQPLIAQMPQHVRVKYAGEVHPAEVRATLASEDLFFLPTRGENFGHVIFESLTSGVPVLISDQTPWGDLEARGAGWNIPLEDVPAFVRAIETASRVIPADREAYARRSIKYARERSDRAASVQRTRDLLAGLVAR